MTDPFLLEAMREVDAMLPATTPIAPLTMGEPRSAYEEMLRYAAFDANKRCFVLEDGAVVSVEEFNDNPRIWALRAFGVSRPR